MQTRNRLYGAACCCVRSAMTATGGYGSTLAGSLGARPAEPRAALGVKAME